MPYDPKDFDASSVKLDRFMKAATDQIGDKYQFGAETSFNDPNPTAFDSSELVEWAAHQAGMHDMPDGSWNQYRYLHEQGATVSVDEALHTKGALVFGFSSDPLDSSDRPARATSGSASATARCSTCSERAGRSGRWIPATSTRTPRRSPSSTPSTTLQPTVDYPGGIGPSHDDTPADPNPPARSVGPDGRVFHEDLPGPDDAPDGSARLLPGRRDARGERLLPGRRRGADVDERLRFRNDGPERVHLRPIRRQLRLREHEPRSSVRHQFRRHQLRRRLTSTDEHSIRCAGKARE